MIRRTRSLPGILAVAAAAVALVGCDVEPEPADTDLDPVPEQPPMDTGMDQQPQEIYEARLEERNGSGVTGTATFTIEGDELQVTVAATGVDPNTRVPQHIHTNGSCDDAGGILLNLDSDLSATGDGEPRGDAYPESDDEGRLQYEASRSIEDLRTAVGDQATVGDETMAGDTAATGGQATTRGAGLDLGNRVVNLHGQDMQPISCGELESTGQTTDM